jgi:teichuronic acid biosynthesis protein TuaE
MTIRKISVIVVVLAAIGLGLSYSKLYLFHIAAAAFFLFWLWKGDLFKGDTIARHVDKYFYFMILWYALSIGWSPKLTDTLIYISYLLFGIVIIEAVLVSSRSIEDQAKLFKALSIAFIIELGLSVLEVLRIVRYPISLFSPYAGLFGRGAVSMDLSILPSVVTEYLLRRPTGFQWNPNDLALLMLMLLPFFIFLKRKLYSRLGVALALLCIIMSAARGVFIGTAVVVPVCYFIKLKRHRFLVVALIAAAIGLAPVLFRYATGVDYLALTRVASSFESVSTLTSSEGDTARPKTSSINLRRTYIEKGMAAFTETKGLGVGAGGDRIVLEGESMHNYWVEVLVDGGILLFATYVFWLLYLFYNLLKVYRSSHEDSIRYYAIASAISLIGFAIGCISASSVIYFFPKWILYGFSMATIYNHRRQLKQTALGLAAVQVIPEEA